MNAWRASKLPGRPTGLLASPYYEWARATGFVYYGRVEWLPVLIELNGTAEAFATLVFEMQQSGPNAQEWAADVRVPPFYAAPPERLKTPIHFIALLARPKFLEAVYRGDAPAERIKRFEIGRATRPSHVREAVPKGEPVAPEPVEGQPQVLAAVIDDGIGFANERFMSSDGTTRIEFVWDQQTPSDIWDFWGYGSELTKRDPVAGIDVRMRASRYGNLIDEDEVYRRSGQLDHSQPGHKPLAPRAAHGTHLMDLVCGSASGPAPGTRPIVAVQLPSVTVEDTSGATLRPQIYNGLCYIIHKAGQLGAGAGRQLPVVVNVSYGFIAGPHDGSDILETAMDELLASCNPPGTAHNETFRVVLPAGNGFLSRCHARFSLAARTSEEVLPSRVLRWRVQPDDRTESFVEIWLPAGADVSAQITAPDDTATDFFGGGDLRTLEENGSPIGEARYFPAGGSGPRARIRLSIAPTASVDGAIAVAPAGLWRIELKNAGNAEVLDIHAWIQRDDTAPGFTPRGRQSYFDDPDDRRYDDGGRAIEADTDARTVASYVKRDGTLNAIATGRQPIVIGGFRRSDRKPARYSASGPLLPAGRPVPHDGPQAMLPSDDAPSHQGVLGAGTRSGSCAVMYGTSVAAPQTARLIAERMVGNQPNDRMAVFNAAAAADPPGTRPAAKRGGGGRIALPSARLPR